LWFSVARKLLIFNGAKIIGIGHLDFFDRLIRKQNLFSKFGTTIYWGHEKRQGYDDPVFQG
jgi:hypothetical protein